MAADFGRSAAGVQRRLVVGHYVGRVWLIPCDFARTDAGPPQPSLRPTLSESLLAHKVPGLMGTTSKLVYAEVMLSAQRDAGRPTSELSVAIQLSIELELGAYGRNLLRTLPLPRY